MSLVKDGSICSRSRPEYRWLENRPSKPNNKWEETKFLGKKIKIKKKIPHQIGRAHVDLPANKDDEFFTTLIYSSLYLVLMIDQRKVL